MNHRADELTRARLWASTLDADDFSTLASLLSAFCIYESPGGPIEGPDAIVASYQASSEWAHATFDTIAWDSECRALADGRALITFIDITDHAGEHHEYRCRQLVEFDANGLVSHIEHQSIESEELALAEFFARVGVSRPRQG